MIYLVVIKKRIPNSQYFKTKQDVRFLIIFIMGFYLVSIETSLFSGLPKVLSFCVFLVMNFALINLFQQLKWSFYLLPLTLISMIIAIAFSRQLAIITIFFQLFILWAWDNSLFPVVMAHCPAAIIAALGLTDIRTRAKIIRLGAACGAALLIMICVRSIFESQHIQITSLKNIMQAEFVKDAFIGFANGFVSGFIFLGILPFIEKWFGVVTDLSLLELADLNQPLLKRLSLEAPGTYHHSLRVGNLAESAAEAIGADRMLTRVGAYYHDIGKLAKPEYFVENESGGDSKHNNLSPTMSTLIITAHVKDGLEIGKIEKLPKRLQDFVIQHHGTSVMKYFYREALEKTSNHVNGNTEEKQGEPEEDNENLLLDAEAFRYPGPKPQTKEVGVVMLADGVEAASRSMSNISPSRLKGLVHEIVTNHLLDGQLDHSNLTLNDLRKIEETFIRVLAGMLHARIKYPE